MMIVLHFRDKQVQMIGHISKKQRVGWIVWSIGALFYCYVIASRMYPNVMMDNLMQHFKADAGQLSFILSSFYLSYATLQIPVGIIVDRFDIRKVLVIACIFGLGGQALFITSSHQGWGALARFIIGVGAAFSYVSALKLAAIWLPKNRFGLITCTTDSLGSVSGVLVEIGLTHYSQQVGYTHAMRLILYIGIAILLLIIFLIRDRRRSTQNYHIGFNQGPLPKQRPLSETLTQVCRNKQAWLIGLVGGLSYVPSALMGDQWGIPYLHRIYHISVNQAGFAMSAMFGGWIVAGPFIGIISDAIKNRKLPLKISFILCAALFSIIIYAPYFSHSTQAIPGSVLTAMLFLIGMGLGTHPLAFVLAKENFVNRIAGTVVGFTNTLIMLISYLCTIFAANFMDWLHGGSPHTSGAYSLHEYTGAMSILPLCFIACLIMLHFIRETGQTLNKKAIQASTTDNTETDT